LVMVLVVTLRGQRGLPGFTSNEADTPETPAAKAESDATSEPASTKAPEPGASAAPSSSAVAVSDGNPFPPPAVARANPQPAPLAGPRTTKTQPKTESEPLPPDDEEEEAGESGTLVGIAIGGSCAFAVDGAPHGTRSSIRVTVPVGPHTVSCSPKGKAPRSQRVNVKPGKPGMATFRLN